MARKCNHKWTRQSRKLAILTVLNNYQIMDIDDVYNKAAHIVNDMYSNEDNPPTTGFSVKCGFKSAILHFTGNSDSSFANVPDDYMSIMREVLYERGISESKFVALFS